MDMYDMSQLVLLIVGEDPNGMDQIEYRRAVQFVLSVTTRLQREIFYLTGEIDLPIAQ